jgi:hypothetical protein
MFFYITHGLSNMVLDYDLSRRYVHNSHSPSPGRQLAVGRWFLHDLGWKQLGNGKEVE